MSTYSFFVHGLHCQSCVILIENELKKNPAIQSIKINLATGQLIIQGDFSNQNPEKVLANLAPPLTQYDYQLSLEPFKKNIPWQDFGIALGISGALVILFFGLQKLGLVNLITSSELNFGAVFFLGIIASTSSCLAVVGGLILSISANCAKSGDKIRPQIFFHLSRLIAFFLLGGLIGKIGSVFRFSAWGTSWLTILTAIVMLFLGLNLLDIFHWTKKFQITFPKFFGTHLLSFSKFNQAFLPILLGVITFFLPCGFTQSMQIYALQVGNFWQSGLTMLAFAFGTFPLLALLSFSAWAPSAQKNSSLFFKTAGFIVIFFAFFNFMNALSGLGLIPPFFNL